MYEYIHIYIYICVCTLSIGGYSSSPDFYAQLYMDKESGKCAEPIKKFGPMDHWSLVLLSSGPPWARISHGSLDTNCSPRCSGI